MDLPKSGDATSRFLAFVEGLTSVIGHADRAKPLRDYCVGLMMPGERKSVEPMAAISARVAPTAPGESALPTQRRTTTDAIPAERSTHDQIAAQRTSSKARKYLVPVI